MTFNRQINSVDVESSLLVNEYYPDFEFSRKVALVRKAATAHKSENSTIRIGRYEYADAATLRKTGKTEIVCEDRFYSYESDPDTDESKVWFINFADPHLFVAYASSLFAQDELQTLEFPLLASAKEYITANKIPGLEPYTKDGAQPTPFLFEGVPYWNRIDTYPLLDNGRHENIYGNSFVCASEEAIAKGVTVFNGNVNSNIMAIAAPWGEAYTRYKRSELEYVLKTLLCSFSAAVETSGKNTVIHGGNWGCGVFGGNKEFMYVAQLICADICGVSRLVLHRVEEDIFNIALKTYVSIPEETTFESLVDFLNLRNYIWCEGTGE